MMRELASALPAYPAARIAAAQARPHFVSLLKEAQARGIAPLAPLPDSATMEAIINAAFWASLRREEGYSPRISLAWLPPGPDGNTLRFERPLTLAPEALVPVAPAVEPHGIHLGVWREKEELAVWGATRRIPPFCFVLEVIAPGLLVIKYRRGEESAKFVNVAVLEGDQVKVIQADMSSLPGCPKVVNALLGLDPAGSGGANVLVQLSVAMRAHGRGGSLLVVKESSDSWLESMVQPIRYVMSPPFAKLAHLLRDGPSGEDEPAWRERLLGSTRTIGHLTSVDGATVINDRYEVLAFGVKIRRRKGQPPIEQVLLTEPIEGVVPRPVVLGQIAGTRHLSAAQFVHDQHDCLALVASQDGHFTVFVWSPCDEMVQAHRIEALLL